MQTHRRGFVSRRFGSLSSFWAATLLVYAASAPFGLSAQAAWPAPVNDRAHHLGVVAADDERASRAGADVLAAGGNAADAAVATALALGVTSPGGSGLGGGGFFVYWDQRNQRAMVLDFRETAPAGASRDMFVVVGNQGKVDARASQIGGRAVAIPGEPAGLFAIETKLGRLGRAQVAAPAIALARRGVTVSPHLDEAIGALFARQAPPAPDGALAKLLHGKSGVLLHSGDLLVRADLAASLQAWAKSGAAPFYTGAIAQQVIATARAQGGILTDADLRGYVPVWRTPLDGHFRGLHVIAAPPPSGGATSIETLQILDALPPQPSGSSAAFHVLAEALTHAFADRARALGDPAFYPVPTAQLVDPAYAQKLAARIDDHTIPVELYGDASLAKTAPAAPRDHGTSHLCVVDKEGNVAALTTTINLAFGSTLLAGNTGILLNDEMDDFSAHPGVPNAYGLIGAEANSIAPGKRPLSSMSPLILLRRNKDGSQSAVACAGGSGGPRIVSETVQVVVNIVDGKMDAQSAVSAPRVHSQWVPSALVYEPETPADVLDALKARGHALQPVLPELRATASQAIVIRPDGVVEGASDPRKGGHAVAP